MSTSPPTLVGGPLTRYPSCFSLDTKLLFLCCGAQIHMYVVATGEHVGTLIGHTRTVIGICTIPNNKLQIISASHDGTIKTWDFYEQHCISTYTVGAPILHVSVCRDHVLINVNRKYYKGKKWIEKQQISQETSQSDSIEKQPSSQESSSSSSSDTKQRYRSCRVMEIPLPHLYQSTITSLPVTRYKSKGCIGLTTSTSQGHIASIAHHTLTITSIDGTGEPIKLVHTRPLTCVTFHPTDSVVATGDDHGQITLWYRYATPGISVVTSTLHWHAHAVTSLIFSEDGAYLLSGGMEAVLVMWQLATGHKQFLPRLGAAITSITISPDGNTYAIACIDNCIRLVNAVNHRVERRIQGLQLAMSHVSYGMYHHHMISTPLLTGLQMDPRSHHLVMNGLYGSLQWYDIYHDRHVYDMDIIIRNVTSRTEDNTPSVTTRIEHVTFNHTGDWMVTVDRRIDISSTSQSTERQSLKIWSYDVPSNRYHMNTRVDAPHHDMITQVIFHPHDNIFVTCSYDYTFRIYKQHTRIVQPSITMIVDTKNTTPVAPIQQIHWSCDAVGTYRAYHIHSCAFSSDGSVLAVSYGQVITLWDPQQLHLQHTLVHPSPSEPVLRMSFIPDSPYLVAYTSRTLYVWNLLTLSVWWSYILPIAALAVDPTSSHFAVIVRPQDVVTWEEQKHHDTEKKSTPTSTSSHLLLFDVTSPIPIRIWTLDDIYYDRHHKIASLSFITQRQTRTRIGTAVPITEVPTSCSLIYWNRHKQIVRYDDIYGTEMDTSSTSTSSASTPSTSTLQKMRKSDHTLSLFEKMYGRATKHKNKSTTPSTSSSSSTPAPAATATAETSSTTPLSTTQSAISQLFHAPAHILPSISTLFTSYMSILLPKTQSSITSSSSSSSSSTSTSASSTSDPSTSTSTSTSTSSKPEPLTDAQLLALDTRNGYFSWDPTPLVTLMERIRQRTSSSASTSALTSPVRRSPRLQPTSTSTTPTHSFHLQAPSANTSRSPSPSPSPSHSPLRRSPRHQATPSTEALSIHDEMSDLDLTHSISPAIIPVTNTKTAQKKRAHDMMNGHVEVTETKTETPAVTMNGTGKKHGKKGKKDSEMNGIHETPAPSKKHRTASNDGNGVHMDAPATQPSKKSKSHDTNGHDPAVARTAVKKTRKQK